MTYRHLKAVVFDWAGTILDHGSLAPMGVFVEAFARFGVPLTIAQARGPMGLPKRDHIKTLMALPEVAAAWREAQGTAPDDAAIDLVYDIFVPMNVEVVPRFATLVPGAAETVAAARASGLKIGSTTGYTRAIMAPLLPLAAAQGYAPDNLVCAGDLPAGRPTPLMMYKTFLDLAVWPASSVVKVDDTAPGIEEGRAAGTWTVGVAVTGNAFGLDLAATRALAPDAFAARRAEAAAELAAADYVIDGVAGLPAVLELIDERLAQGERRQSASTLT